MTDIQQLPLILNKRPQHRLHPAVTRSRFRGQNGGEGEGNRGLLTGRVEGEGRGWHVARKHEQERADSRSDSGACRRCVAEKVAVLTQQYTCSQLL